MGVQGLWELLAPVGRRVSVETLSGRKLAIDASIWMVQFMKAMRDERGEMVRNAHLIGFFRRICKLLFLRVKPVFVFDGGTPALKRRTVIARRRRRENASAKIRKTAEKLLLNQLKARKLEQLAHDIESVKGKENVTEEVSEGSKGRGRKRNRGGSMAKTGETSREDGPSNKIQVGSNSFTGAAPENSQVNFQDAYQSTDALLAASLEAEGQLDTDANDLRDDIPSDGGEDGDQMMIPEIQGKVDPAVLSVLPPSMQLDLLVQMREQLMAENRQKFRKAKKAPASFSQLQIESYLKTVAFRREIEEIQKSASGRAVGGVQTSRIASESNREFIFSSSFTGDKQLLNTDNIGNRSEHQASNATSMSSTLLSQDSTAQTSNKGLHENSDHAEQTYIDDRGKTRVSRVRGMGVRLTRDLQWNLYLMKESEARVLENDRCISNEKLLTPQSQSKELNNVGEEEVGIEHPVWNKKKSEDPCSSLSMSQDPSLLAMPELGTGKSYKISFTVDEIKQESDDDLFDSLVSGVMNDNEKIKPTGLSQSKEDSSECEWEDGEVKQASDGEMQKGYLNSGDTYLSDVAHGSSDIEWEDGNDFTPNDTKYSLNDSTFQKSNRLIENEELQKAIKLSVEADNQKHHERILSEQQPEYVVVDDKDGKVDAAMEDCVSAKTASESAFNIYKDFSSAAFDRIGTTIQEEDLLECDKSLPSCVYASPKKKYLTEDEELQEALKRSLDDIHCPKENLSSLTESGHADNINKNEECVFDKYLDNKIVGDGEKQLTIMGDINNSREFNVGLKGVVQNSAAVENMPAKVDEEVLFSSKGDIIHQSHEGDAVIVDDQSCIPGEIQKSGLFRINSESHSKSRDSTSQINNTNKVVAERDSVIIEDVQKLPLDNSSLDEVLQNKLPEYNVDSSDEKDLLALREEEVVERNETERDLEIDNEAAQLDIAEEIALLRQEELDLRAAQKQNERNAESVSNEMFTECQELLQMFGLPYIIAPMEAEAQCAFMELSQLVDGVVTDDCDAFLFGAETVYKNIFDNRKYVETYLMKDIERELGLNREKLIQMALLLGSDYTEGISGIGIVNAIEVVNAFSEEDGLKTFREWLDSPDTTILDKLDGKRKAPGKKSKHCNKQGNVTEHKDDLLLDINETGSEEGDSQEPHSVLKKIFMAKHRAISKNWHVPDSFPNAAVISAYSTPQVDTSTEPFSWGRPDLMSLRKLCWEKFGWAKEKADDLLLPVLKEHDRHETQLRMEAFYSFNERFAKIRSRRIQKAVTGITGSRSSDLMDLPPHLKSHPKSNITKAKKNDKPKDARRDGSGEMGGTDNVTRLSDPLNSSIAREIDKNENTAVPNNSSKTGKKMTRKESLTRRGQVKRKEGKARRTSNKDKLCNKSQSSEDDSDKVNASEDVDYLKKKVPHENLQTRKSSRRKKNVNYALDEHGSDTADYDNDKYSDSSFEVAEKLKEKKQSSIDSPREDRDESTPIFRDRSYELMDEVYLPDHLTSGGGFCDEEDDSANLELKDGTFSPTGKIMDFDHLRSGGGFCDEADDSVNLKPKDGVASSVGKTMDSFDSDAILISSNVNSNSKKDHDAVASEGGSCFAKADNSSERSETILKKCESSDLFEEKQNKIDDEDSVKGLRAIPFLRRRKKK